MRPRYAYYGDDFTGSTDVLEQLAEGGVPAILFLRQPDAALRARFADVQAVGLAGDSRSRSPDWMDAHLPAAFDAIGDADILHYKTCSTFDSSSTTGSIGRAMEIGARRHGGVVPILVGAPHLRRYVLFGNLFAAAGDTVFRIDRHPTMARHPVTPMHEADLRRHLAAQTDMTVASIGIDRIQAGATDADFVALVDDAVLFDGLDEPSLLAAGQVVLRHAARFAVGSSGVTRALVLAWQATGLVTPPEALAPAPPTDRLLVVSGSCSPVTAAQIGHARGAGYAGVRVDVPAILRGDSAEEARIADAAVAALEADGRCVIFSAEGPLNQQGQAAGDRLGSTLGRVTRAAIVRSGIGRVLFAGGDTSSHGVAQLGIDALSWVAPLERGAPLVCAHADVAPIDGLELVLKGGQVGREDFFETVRLGRSG